MHNQIVKAIMLSYSHDNTTPTEVNTDISIPFLVKRIVVNNITYSNRDNLHTVGLDRILSNIFVPHDETLVALIDDRTGVLDSTDDLVYQDFCNYSLNINREYLFPSGKTINGTYSFRLTNSLRGQIDNLATVSLDCILFLTFEG